MKSGNYRKVSLNELLHFNTLVKWASYIYPQQH